MWAVQSSRGNLAFLKEMVDVLSFRRTLGPTPTALVKVVHRHVSRSCTGWVHFGTVFYPQVAAQVKAKTPERSGVNLLLCRRVEEKEMCREDVLKKLKR